MDDIANILDGAAGLISAWNEPRIGEQQIQMQNNSLLSQMESSSSKMISMLVIGLLAVVGFVFFNKK